MTDIPPPPPPTPPADKPRHPRSTVRCGNSDCRRFLCMATVVPDIRTLGTLVRVEKLVCPHCKYENSFDVQVKEKDPEPQRCSGG